MSKVTINDIATVRNAAKEIRVILTSSFWAMGQVVGPP